MREIKFTKSEIRQLLGYWDMIEREGVYWGHVKHFENRHLSIRDKLISVLKEDSK